jgi:hypothetical protein
VTAAGFADLGEVSFGGKSIQGLGVVDSDKKVVEIIQTCMSLCEDHISQEEELRSCGGCSRPGCGLAEVMSDESEEREFSLWLERWFISADSEVKELVQASLVGYERAKLHVDPVTEAPAVSVSEFG